MKVPTHIRDQVKARLWTLADKLHWLRLSDRQRADLYDRWSRDTEVTDLLARHMSNAKIRVYVKDSIMKPYPRERLADPERPMRLLELAWDGNQRRKYVKPHGVVRHDGILVCWGSADDWKAVLMACFERAWDAPRIDRTAAVLFNAIGPYADQNKRRFVEAVASRLDISRIIWDSSFGQGLVA